MMKEYRFKINGKEYNVSVGEAGAQSLAVNVNGADYQVEISSSASLGGTHPSVAEKKADAPSGVSAPASAVSTAPVASQAASGAATQVASPLPGVIVEVSVKEGQAVKAGQKVAVLEAMKMENEIPATKDGIVSEIHVNKGDSVLEGAPIVSIA
jgi:biotin carboxyl carrier protein